MQTFLRKVGEYLRTKDGRDQVAGWAIKVSVSLVLAIASATIITLQQTIFAPPATKLQRELRSEISALLPEDKRKPAYWSVVYQYQDAASIRCRAAGIYPIGSQPKIDKCTSTGQATRKKSLEEHTVGHCVVLRRSQVVPNSSQLALWKLYDLEGVATCPIFVNGELWGYAGISYPVFQDGDRKEIELRRGIVAIETNQQWIAVAKEFSVAIENYFRQHPDRANVELSGEN